MRCSVAREALSAAYDGEVGVVDPVLVRRHLSACPGCHAYERGLDALADAVAIRTSQAAPDLTERVLAAAARRPRGRRSTGLVEAGLRLGAAVSGALGVVIAVRSLGGHEEHSGHEAVVLTLALCLGLVLAGVRPRLAAAYLPVVGLGGLMIAVSAVVDIDDGVVSLTHESDHLVLLAGCLFLAGLAGWRHRPPGGRLARRDRARPPAPTTLHVVPRALRVGVRVGAAIALAVGLAAVAAPASAHAVLEASSPGQDTVLRSAPTRVSLRFDEAVTLLPTSVRVYAPDGSRADDGHVVHPGGAPREAAVGVHATRGTYLVTWRVVSADSHPVSGAFAFSVGTRTATPEAGAAGTDATLQILLGATRLVTYVGTALLLGGLLLVLVGGAGGRTRRLARYGAAGVGVAAAVALLLKGPLDAGLGLGAVGRPSLLAEVMGTTYGWATAARILLAALGAGLAAAWPRLRGPVARAMLALLGVALAVSLALAGHSGLHPLNLVVDTLHVLAMSAWIGGLVAVLADALPARRAAAVGRFSTVALTAVAVLVVTGVVQAWQQVGAWGALTTTSYGQYLLTKVVLVAMAVTFAAGSRVLLRRVAWDRLRTTVVLESVALAVVLLLTSALTATEPAKDAWRPRTDTNLHLLGDTVQVSAVPTGAREAELHLFVFGRGGRPVDPADLSADIRLPGKDIGPLPVRLQNAGPGHRIASVSVPVAGRWQLAVTMRTTDIDEDSAYVTVPLR